MTRYYNNGSYIPAGTGYKAAPLIRKQPTSNPVTKTHLIIEGVAAFCFSLAALIMVVGV